MDETRTFVVDFVSLNHDDDLIDLLKTAVDARVMLPAKPDPVESAKSLRVTRTASMGTSMLGSRSKRRN